MHSSFIVAAAAAVACAVMVSAPATGGEAEDAARAKVVVEGFKADRAARIRAGQRAWKAVQILYDCRDCALREVEAKAEYYRDVQDAVDVLTEEFYQEELRK